MTLALAVDLPPAAADSFVTPCEKEVASFADTPSKHPGAEIATAHEQGKTPAEQTTRIEGGVIINGNDGKVPFSARVAGRGDGVSARIEETLANGGPHRKVSKEDFQLLKVIGMGAFGKVLQASDLQP